MQRTKIGSNQSEVHYGRIQVFYSYETPVAGYHPEKGWFRTEEYYSVTTSKHINKLLAGHTDVVKVPQKWINSLVE